MCRPEFSGLHGSYVFHERKRNKLGFCFIYQSLVSLVGMNHPSGFKLALRGHMLT